MKLTALPCQRCGRLCARVNEPTANAFEFEYGIRPWAMCVGDCALLYNDRGRPVTVASDGTLSFTEGVLLYRRSALPPAGPPG